MADLPCEVSVGMHVARPPVCHSVRPDKTGRFTEDRVLWGSKNQLLLGPILVLPVAWQELCLSELIGVSAKFRH